jgi:Ca2+:H+ antiporter
MSTTQTPQASGFNLRRFLLSGDGWPYLLVPFIPLAIALELAHAAASLVFVAAALGVIPTAALMGRATEELAARSGSTSPSATPPS